MASSDLEVRPASPELEEGDHDRFAHYVRKSDQARAYIEGVPIRALCGKVWVPNRDPSKFPVCSQCKEIRERLRGSD